MITIERVVAKPTSTTSVTLYDRNRPQERKSTEFASYLYDACKRHGISPKKTKQIVEGASSNIWNGIG